MTFSSGVAERRNSLGRAAVGEWMRGRGAVRARPQRCDGSITRTRSRERVTQARVDRRGWDQLSRP
jgi:hypothetical protein